MKEESPREPRKSRRNFAKTFAPFRGPFLRMRLTLASPHRYPDLARLWFRSVEREMLPALRRHGLDVEVVIFQDGRKGGFEESGLPGVRLDGDRPRARDFVEFYDAVLRRAGDYLFLLDADLFILDGGWAASFLQAFDDPRLAAVSMLRRSEQPGVYALLCRSEAYRSLASPVFAACYEGVASWPNAVNRQPGDRAAMRLRSQGWKILDVDPQQAESRLADFHGTTVIRASQEHFGHILGPRRFEALVSRKRYFAMGAYDNALLGALHRHLFDEPFAAGPDGGHLTGSLPWDSLRRAVAAVQEPEVREELRGYFERSDRAARRLAAHFCADVRFPSLLPELEAAR